MPGMHLPKFEKSAALSHHCGVCCKPLTNTSAINTCIGKHEVICTNYHFTFHFVGKAHQCQACTHAETLLQGRHRAIAELVHEFKTLYQSNPDTTAAENGGMITPPLQLEEPITPTKKLKKKEKKDLKRIEKAANRAKIVTQADIAELGEMMYPNGIGGTANVDSLLSEALSIKFQPSVFSEVRLMEKLMIPSGTTPNHTAEVDRVLNELEIQRPATDKEEARLWNKIRTKLREDMEITWNGSVQMKRRRIIYAQWVSQGAVDAMAQWAEDWDIGTGWKIDGGFYVTAAGKESEVETDTDVVVGAEESSEEDADVDDTATVTSSLSGLSIGKSRAPGTEKPKPPPLNSNIQMIKDERRGGSPRVERLVQTPRKLIYFRASDEDVAPSPGFRPIFVATDPENSMSKTPRAPPVLRIVPNGSTSPFPIMKESVAPSAPLDKPWNAVAAVEPRQKRKADTLAANPPPLRVMKITAPVQEEVDDGTWIAVEKKGKAKRA
ncbi:gb [Venturia nashicola]|nr:gb [Venturia nashicola]